MLDPVIARQLIEGRQRILITGASGWIGLATLEALAEALGSDFGHRVHCFGSVERELELRGGIRVRQLPLDELRALPSMPSWLLHFAFLTKDRAESMSETDYRAANERISGTVLGALDKIGVSALFLASSGAASKADDPAASPAMRLYGALKRDDEERFAAWADAAGKRAVISRIFAITGPYINKHEAYAIASFILDGLAGRTIEVRATRPVIRAYVAIRELMSLSFALMAAAPTGTVRFDSGGEPLELADVAATVAGALPPVRVARAAISDDVADRYHGDVKTYAGLLSAHRIEPVPLLRQVEETIDYIRASQ